MYDKVTKVIQQQHLYRKLLQKTNKLLQTTNKLLQTTNKLLQTTNKLKPFKRHKM